MWDPLYIFSITFPLQVFLLWALVALYVRNGLKKKDWHLISLFVMPLILLVLYVITSFISATLSATLFWSVFVSVPFVVVLMALVFAGSRYKLSGFGKPKESKIKSKSLRTTLSVLLYFGFVVCVLAYIVGFLFVTMLGLYTDMDNQQYRIQAVENEL